MKLELNGFGALSVHRLSKYLFIITVATMFIGNVQAFNNNNRIEQIEHLLFYYPQQGEMELQLFSRGHEIFSMSDKNKISYLKGILDYKKSNTDSAIAHAQKALLYFAKVKDMRYLGKAKLLLANIAEKIGDVNQASIYYCEVIETTDQKLELGYAYLGIARCKRYADGIKKTRNLQLEKGAELLKSIGKKEYDIYVDYMKVFLCPKKQDHKQQLLTIGKEYENMGIKVSAAAVYKNLSVLYLKENKLDSSAYYVDKALPLSITVYPSMSIAPTLYHIKGVLDYRRKDYKKAQKNYNYALFLSDSLHQNAVKYYIYKSLAKLDSTAGSYNTARLYKELAKSYKLARSNDKSISQFDTNKLSAKITIQETQLKIERSKENKYLLVIILVVVVIVGATILLLLAIRFLHTKGKLQSKHKQEQHIRQMEFKEQLQQMFCQRNENIIEKQYQLQQDKVKMQRKLQQAHYKSLEAYKQYQKEMFCQRDQKRIEALHNFEQQKIQMQHTLNIELQERNAITMHYLLLTLGQQIYAKTLDKERVKELFSYVTKQNKVNEDFEKYYAKDILAFEEKLPSFGKSEIRYAVLFCLDLPINVISYIRQFNPDAVRKGKSRILVKLGLKAGANLKDHFSNVLGLKVSGRGIIKILNEAKQLPINNLSKHNGAVNNNT